MKQIILATLLSIVAITASFSQKTIPAQATAMSRQWSLGAQSLLKLAAKPATVDRLFNLQLDSTKTFIAYGAPDSTPFTRTRYEYPQANVKIVYNDQFENGEWLRLDRSTLHSDQQQRLVLAEAESFDPATGMYQIDSRLRIYPHGNSETLIDSMYTFQWDTVTQTWVTLFATFNTFDDQDRLEESRSLFDFLGSPVIFKDVYKYDANGDNVLIQGYAIFDNTEIPNSLTEISYMNHKPVETIVSAFTGFGFEQQSRGILEYTTFGEVEHVRNYEWDVSISNWRLTEMVDYTFDAEQRIDSKESIKIDQDGQEEREQAQYTYQQADDLASETISRWDPIANDWAIEARTYYYYNGVTAVKSPENHAFALEMAPNPTIGRVKINLGDQAAAVQVFDQSGRMIRASVMQPDEILDLSAMPNGIYQVTAQQGRNFYSGKVVKD